MNIHIENATQQRIPRQHVLARVTRALKRLAASTASARITFSDLNGPKGGADIRCALLVSVPGRPPIRAEHAATTPRLAFDEGYERVSRQLEALRLRRREASRRPKKYFAARRLLA
jgi:hypothetical protein